MLSSMRQQFTLPHSPPPPPLSIETKRGGLSSRSGAWSQENKIVAVVTCTCVLAAGGLLLGLGIGRGPEDTSASSRVEASLLAGDTVAA